MFRLLSLWIVLLGYLFLVIEAFLVLDLMYESYMKVFTVCVFVTSISLVSFYRQRGIIYFIYHIKNS